MSLLILSAVLTLAAGADDTPTPAAQDPAPPTEAQMKASEQKADANRVVCRRETPVGSHRPKKMCLTKGQWAEWDDQNKDKLNNQTLQDPTPGVSSAQ